MSKLLYLLACILLAIYLLASCKKEETTPQDQDQPVSVSITVDGKTSVEAAIR